MKNDDKQPTVASPIESVVMLQALQELRDLTQTQCSGGNWNYDPYMQGMANGMILALSLFDGKEPVFLEQPECWLKDLPETENRPPETIAT